ncbi:MAG: hypothetical protein L6R40_005738 [Gallowayella cf. fulva]|nr:MAG: hypothetical protein L6R40_005738 [Xanthomendoza cf. fulva]
MNQSPLSLRILSHNVRYATTALFKNERPWKERLPLIMNELFYNTRPYMNAEHHDQQSTPSAAAFICLQEVLHGQLSDILHELNGIKPKKQEHSLPTGPLWAHIGVAREDGHTMGEYCPIIYPVQQFDLLHFENLWLSPTPDVPSKGWDAGSERVLTAGVFRSKLTRQIIIASCTHLDNAGSESRKKSVGIILQTIESLRREWHAHGSYGYEISAVGEQEPAVFLAGDFNSQPDQEAYLALAASNLMCDLRNYVEPQMRYGDIITFTGFDRAQDEEDQGRIDFIWLGPKDQVSGHHCIEEEGAALDVVRSPRWIVEGYAVLPNQFEDGVYSSDHRCVVGDVVLYPGKSA